MSKPERTDTVADSIAAPAQYDGDVVIHDGGHWFEGERCVYCRTNVYDIGIYPDAPTICPTPREPVSYSTESRDPYPGVGALFNADLHAIDPTYAPREDWIVKGPRRIEHVGMGEQ
ncbi:hypothetical protein SEA_ROBSFEET_8 [Microbacterium phage RobsFeet]|uniref:Uncharacterized protein n=1 Tax=Microbacterium phage RobsFeet TaxID=2201442 RepID=A0A2Z4Q803_9CAUD|nr:hypothetical protein HOT43_gp08 [Microbacterium phage RobsFeet]AWY06015.1 hypothetical protein SEA_ROBSFEET_8 [Microbacterium phage RobsFeet]